MNSISLRRRTAPCFVLAVSGATKYEECGMICYPPFRTALPRQTTTTNRKRGDQQTSTKTYDIKCGNNISPLPLRKVANRKSLFRTEFSYFVESTNPCPVPVHMEHVSTSAFKLFVLFVLLRAGSKGTTVGESPKTAISRRSVKRRSATRRSGKYLRER